MSAKKVLITDLDNTLFDWVELWYQCFSSMLQQISNISGVSEDRLKEQIRHNQRGSQAARHLGSDNLQAHTAATTAVVLKRDGLSMPNRILPNRQQATTIWN